ncbi:MAG: hypothetical protein KF745_07165 [Phycisphaeraceae bacterium]|nr:hypothetical protein [Phycisphaeraceae bacterium]
MDTPDTTPDPALDPAPPVTVTRLNSHWLMKMAIFFIVLVGLGSWGLYDATIAYPARGQADASYQLKEYLAAAKTAGRLSQTRVTDPVTDLADLQKRRAEFTSAARDTATGNGRIAAMELAKLQWLESLSRVWALDSATARITDPEKQLAELTAEWNTRGAPKPLSGLDMFFQWLFVAIGGVGAAWVALVVLWAGTMKFRFDPATLRLTLPGAGTPTIAPADIKEFDKRKWHKFFVTLNLKDGRQVKLDLLRYTPLEDWILQMERAAFPESGAEAAEPATA